MPAAIYFPKEAAFLRIGQVCHDWGDDYRVSLDVEILKGIGIIGGLDRDITREEYLDAVRKVAEHGLRPAKYRAPDLKKLIFLPGAEDILAQHTAPKRLAFIP